MVDLASAEVRNPLVIRRAVDDAATSERPRRRRGAAAKHLAGALRHRCLGDAHRRIALRGDRRRDASADRPHRHRRRRGAQSHVMAAAGLGRAPRTAAPLRASTRPWSGTTMPDARRHAASCSSWAGRVLDDMERCGLSRCAEGANATNPLVRPIKIRLSSTPPRPGSPTRPRTKALLLSSIIADSRPITDDAVGTRGLRRHADHHPQPRLPVAAAAFHHLGAPASRLRIATLWSSTPASHRGHLDLRGRRPRPDRLSGPLDYHASPATTAVDDHSAAPRPTQAGLLTGARPTSLVRAFEYIYELVLDTRDRSDPQQFHRVDYLDCPQRARHAHSPLPTGVLPRRGRRCPRCRAKRPTMATRHGNRRCRRGLPPGTPPR